MLIFSAVAALIATAAPAGFFLLVFHSFLFFLGSIGFSSYGSIGGVSGLCSLKGRCARGLVFIFHFFVFVFSIFSKSKMQMLSYFSSIFALKNQLLKA